MAKSDSGQRRSSSARAGSTSSSGSGERRTRDRGAAGARDANQQDAPTSTIPVYSPAFPEPNFDLATRAAASASGGVAGATTGGAQGGQAEGGTGKRSRPRRPRRAQLQLRHINPWTVLRFSCVLAIALFFVWLIVVGVLYGVLDAAGVIDKINSAVTTINGEGSNAPITAGIVFGGAAIIGVVNMILFIALSTVGSVVYNLCADLVGGIEITLSEA